MQSDASAAARLSQASSDIAHAVCRRGLGGGCEGELPAQKTAV